MIFTSKSPSYIPWGSEHLLMERHAVGAMIGEPSLFMGERKKPLNPLHRTEISDFFSKRIVRAPYSGVHLNSGRAATPCKRSFNRRSHLYCHSTVFFIGAIVETNKLDIRNFRGFRHVCLKGKKQCGRYCFAQSRYVFLSH